MDIEQDDLAPGRGTVRSRGRERTAYRTAEGRVRYWPSATAAGWQYAGGAVAATFQLDRDPYDDPPAGSDRAARADSGAAPGSTDQVTVDAWLTHHRVRDGTAAHPVRRDDI